MSKIKCAFLRNKNYVAFTVYEMDERFNYINHNDVVEYKAKNGICIKSEGSIAMSATCNTIWLCGKYKDKNSKIDVCCLLTETEAIEWIEKVKEALTDWAENWEGWEEKNKETIQTNDYIEIFEV